MFLDRGNLVDVMMKACRNSSQNAAIFSHHQLKVRIKEHILEMSVMKK